MVKRLAIHIGDTLLASLCIVIAVQLWQIGEVAWHVRKRS